MWPSSLTYRHILHALYSPVCGGGHYPFGRFDTQINSPVNASWRTFQLMTDCPLLKEIWRFRIIIIYLIEPKTIKLPIN